MSTVAQASTAVSASCDDCGKEIKPTDVAYCVGCADAAMDEAADDFECDHAPAPQLIRAWAQRRFLLGQITREVREALDQAAEDIEVGHG